MSEALIPAEAAENNKKYFVAKSKQYHDINLVTPCAYETKVILEYSILLEPKISLERSFHLIAPDWFSFLNSDVQVKSKHISM